MNRQHSHPYIVSGDKVQQLQPGTGAFTEDWIQDFVFKHPQAIPVNEIEPAFGSLISVCRELPTNVGPLDILFINPAGFLTFAECKLWKNPEARREVVGQILDYAKEISQWSYEDLEKAINKTQKAQKISLHELVSQHTEEVDESDFVDSVSRNLRRGSFLLLIIGDGIRESVEQIADFLQRHAHLNFAFALVEFGIFELSNQEDGNYFVQPRILAQTVEIERVTFKIEGNLFVSAPSLETKPAVKVRPTKISEQVFFEKLHIDLQTATQLKALLAEAQNMGLYVEPGNNSLILKSVLHDINFGVFRVQGDFYNCGIMSTTEDMGCPQLGEEYLSGLAKLLQDGFVSQGKSHFWWTVKIKGDRYAAIPEVLAVKDQWLELIRKTLDQITKVDTK